jgi:carboxypeptidase T
MGLSSIDIACPHEVRFRMNNIIVMNIKKQTRHVEIARRFRYIMVVHDYTAHLRKTPMRFLLLSAVTLFFTSVVPAQTVKQVRIFVPDKPALDQIWSTGIDYEGATGKIGGWMEFVAGEFELSELASKGISYQVVVDDLTAYYKTQLSPAPVNALGFGYGSMGGFYTFAEVIQQLDSMRLLYPNLITVRDSIGRSQEGRALWVAKISDNPDIHEPNEPEVFYTSLTHAREPQGMMTIMYYMWWLLENYGTNPEATYLVNNRQMYFLPVFNPDGYVYNQSINPDGGGNWRKNRRNNGGGVYGVDLNRNYGPYYMWNAPNGGSSTSPSSDTYRGPAEFSEPETQAVDNFMRTHNIKTAFNYHTYGNYLIYPFGYLSRENHDSLIYRDWTYDMTFANHYTNGTDQQTVNYSTRGNSDDYMYGDTTKPITYTMTPEVGTTGFWPSSSLILPLAIENLPQNKFLSYFAGHYPTLRHYEIQDAGGNGFLDRGENFTLATRWKNRGLGEATNISVTISSSNSFVEFPSPSIQTTMASQAEQLLSFAGVVNPHAVTGVSFQVYLTTTDAQGFLKHDTLTLFLGTPTVVFADSASNGTGNWTTGQGWGVTANAHTPPYAFTDSPSGNYSNNANNSLTLNSQLNLNGFNHAQLRFWAKWAIEPSWDFAMVEISTNNGTTWATLRSKLSHSGSGRSTPQTTGTWGYESYTPGLTWVEQDVDLSSYVNRQIKLRFRVAADVADNRDGLYVDDIRLYGFTTNTDSGIAVRPSEFFFTGAVGSVFDSPMLVNNFSNDTAHIIITESSGAARGILNQRGKSSGSMDNGSIIKRLRPAFEKMQFPSSIFQQRAAQTDDPQVFTTIITDERGEGILGSADVYRVQHQLRTGLSTYHDFRIVMAVVPDTAVAGFISVDTDQDFTTGAFPTPYGIGPTSRDVGSEREIFFDASGIIIDSLIGLGRIPAGVVISTSTDTIIGLPFLLTITRDSVLTIGTNSLIGGIQESWLGDNNRNMNIGVVAARIGANSNPLPDFAPQVGHGIVGVDSGVSWLSQTTRELVLLPGDSAEVGITALAAKNPGSYNAELAVRAAGVPTVHVPITMTVVAIPLPHIMVDPTTIIDTVALGDSVTHFVTIHNTGVGQLAFGIIDTAGAPWLSLSPQFGILDSGQIAIATVTIRSFGLSADSTYTARFFVASNDPAANSIPVEVVLRVSPIVTVREREGVPTTFGLAQNYPNPFNPATNVKFQMANAGHVSIRVYDLLGREVLTLVNGDRVAGYYEVSFEASALASGVYFYRMTAGHFTQTRKMLLIR